jgi:CheY-like chemotaxis protein
MSQKLPLIVGFVDNLMFSTRIETAVETLGFKMHWMEKDYWESGLDAGNSVFNRIKQLNPILILVDLGMGGIPWNAFIQNIKANPTTAQIPIICFGSHMDADTLKGAHQAGANEVVARSRFFSALPELIKKHLS